MDFHTYYHYYYYYFKFHNVCTIITPTLQSRRSQKDNIILKLWHVLLVTMKPIFCTLTEKKASMASHRKNIYLINNRATVFSSGMWSLEMTSLINVLLKHT